MKQIPNDKTAMKCITITNFQQALENVYSSMNNGCQHLRIGLVTHGKQACRRAYNLREALHFVDDVTRLAKGRAVISWTRSMHQLLGREFERFLYA